MRTLICWIATLIVSASVAVGQQRPSGQAKVLTVCEVLGDLTKYVDTAVIVVGRIERRASLIDQHTFLSQDRCEHPVITNGHVWLEMIEVLTPSPREKGETPSERPKLEQSIIAGKLSMVQKTTKLGVHMEPQFKADERSHTILYTHTAEVPNSWGAIYGRIEGVAKLNKDCGPEGCGGDDQPALILAQPYNIHRLSEDGAPLSENH